MMRQKVIETAKHEIHEVQATLRHPVALVALYSLMPCNAQAGTDTLAALVARTIAAAKLKVQANVARVPHHLKLSAPSHRVYQEEEAQDGINPLPLEAAPVEERVNGPDGQ